MTDSPSFPEPEDLNELFEKYIPKLVSLADRRISGQMKSKFGAEDVVGSVCRTVVRRIRNGKIQFEDDAELWRLLVTVTKRKISNKVRHFQTQSRSVENEIAEAANSILKTPEPSAEEAVAFSELMGLLMETLSEQEQQILIMRMENHNFQEIANQLGVAERTPRRKMNVIKEKLLEIFDTEHPNQ